MKKLALLASIALLACGGFAHAQSTVVTPPILANTTQNDLIQDVPQGYPSAQAQYVKIGTVAGVPAYVNGGALSGTTNTFTFGNTQTDYFGTFAASGTIAFTAAANPSDGQRACVNLSGAGTPTLSFLANTGQTVVGGASGAKTSGTTYCWTYVALAATWYVSP